MENQNAKESVRIDKDLLEKARFISKSRGQTISGYLNVCIGKQIERDWLKVQKQKDGENGKI